MQQHLSSTSYVQQLRAWDSTQRCRQPLCLVHILSYELAVVVIRKRSSRGVQGHAIQKRTCLENERVGGQCTMRASGREKGSIRKQACARDTQRQLRVQPGRFPDTHSYLQVPVPVHASTQVRTRHHLIHWMVRCDLQIEVRVQLDTLPNSPRIMEAVRSFNADQPSVSITLYPTPPYTSPRDISFDRPTLATDGRWSDFYGGTMDDISVYLEPKFQRVQHLMHFRRDIFRRHNVSRAPQTWAELLELTARLNGTDFDGDGTPDYALCYNMQQHCRAPYMLMEAPLPMLYYAASTVKPLHLDPLTLEPRFMNAATRAALLMLTQLSAFNSPASSAACYPYDTRFCAGAPAPRSVEGQGTGVNVTCALWRSMVPVLLSQRRVAAGLGRRGHACWCTAVCSRRAGRRLQSHANSG
jgi:hypothetical protein